MSMKDMGIINCSTAQAIPLIVGKDTVYVHTDIEQVKTDSQGKPTENLWKCHEVQYDKDEYIELMKEGIKVYKEIRNEIKMVYQNKTVDSI